MIRREEREANGQRRWILIAQADHARLAGQLAEHWGAAGFPPIEPRDDVLAAIYEHDDGWVEWDQRPDVDPERGRPLDFTEMPLEHSLAIWRTSIRRAAQTGPLPAYAVSGHFTALLRRSQSWRQADAREEELAREFLEKQDRQQAQWLREWQQAEEDSASERTVEIAQRALALLQMFDLWSLWLCCAPRDSAFTLEAPNNRSMTLEPRTPQQIAISPWPLTVSSLELTVGGRAIEASRYADREALASAEGEPVELAWSLRPA